MKIKKFSQLNENVSSNGFVARVRVFNEEDKERDLKNEWGLQKGGYSDPVTFYHWELYYNGEFIYEEDTSVFNSNGKFDTAEVFIRLIKSQNAIYGGMVGKILEQSNKDGLFKMESF